MLTMVDVKRRYGSRRPGQGGPGQGGPGLGSWSRELVLSQPELENTKPQKKCVHTSTVKRSFKD